MVEDQFSRQWYGQNLGRHLQLYPECAALLDLAPRKECCDVQVQSTAGRSFCYSQITFLPGTFNSCQNEQNDFDAINQCCDILAGEDKSTAFSCKETILQEEVDEVAANLASQCTTDDDVCTQKFIDQIETIEQDIKQLEVGGASRTESDSKINQIGFVLIFPALIALICAFLSCRTRCFKKSVRSTMPCLA